MHFILWKHFISNVYHIYPIIKHTSKLMLVETTLQNIAKLIEKNTFLCIYWRSTYIHLVKISLYLNQIKYHWD